MSDDTKAVLEVLLAIQRELVQLNARMSRIEDGEASISVNVENSVEVRGCVETWSSR